jgi:hypothetical protein
MTCTKLFGTAGQAALSIMLMSALPALANDGDGAAMQSIITPGFGTLGAIFEWLRLLLA